MERHRYRPSPGASFKLYHILDHFEDSATRWSPTTGLAAEDTSKIPNTEEELIQSIVDYFCNYFSRPNPTPYVPAVLRQQVDIEALKQRVGEEILVLEIEVEKIMPDACIYPVRDVVTGCNLEWPGDPRSGWGSKYLILHRVPREAITVYTPDELLEKERGVRRLENQAIENEVLGALRARQVAERHSSGPVQDIGSTRRDGRSAPEPFFRRWFKGRRR